MNVERTGRSGSGVAHAQAHAHEHMDEHAHAHVHAGGFFATRALGRGPRATPACFATSRLARACFAAASLLTGSLLLGACGEDFTPETSGGGASGTGGTGGTAGSGGTGAQGGGGAGGGTPAACVPSELGSGEAPADGCGVFVSSSVGDDGNAGTKDAPFATLGAAIDSGATVIYACTDGFSEAVTLAAGTTLFGGLDCTNGWAYVGAETRSPLTAPADAIPLTLASGSATTRVEDMAVTAASAAAAGGSSIAFFANGATAELVRSSFTAGDGAPGESAQALPPDGALDGTNGENGNPALGAGSCAAQATNPGGAGGPKTCGGTVVDGGAGGLGSYQTSGGNGDEGQPTTVDTTGDGGTGQPAVGQCEAGHQGALGDPGTSGTGASGIGTIDALGYHGADGTVGGIGVPGQGGGGGGGGRCNAGVTGPSGGGGGSGGCGGAGGDRGRAAGSSIALLSFDSALSLTTCTVTTAAGAAGGDGAAGQDGGYGGQIGLSGGNGACNGAQGGNGGPGGPGGGGHGGHSVGIAFDGGAAPVTTDTTFSLGTVGPGGLGGTSPALDGEAGQSCQSLDFGSGDCTQG